MPAKKPRSTSKKTATSSAAKTAQRAATKAAKGAATKAAKGAAKSAAKGAAKGANKAVVVGAKQVGRGTRWTDEQVRILLDTVHASDTAKEAFEALAVELDKSVGTISQKYYNLQKAAGVASSGRGRPRAARSSNAPRSKPNGVSESVIPTPAQLRRVTVDELVGLATHVRTEVDRRRRELDKAERLIKG